MAVHNCKYCKTECGFGGENKKRDCVVYTPMTNADRIRAMSDEELKYIVRAVLKAEDCPVGDTKCIDCVFHDLCLRGDYYYGIEEEWLKQPAEEG